MSHRDARLSPLETEHLTSMHCPSYMKLSDLIYDSARKNLEMAKRRTGNGSVGGVIAKTNETTSSTLPATILVEYFCM